MQCCQVAVFMYSPIDFSGFQHCLGEGGLPKIRNDGTTKLMTTGYRYPEHKCTLQALFSYLSQKILARIVVQEGVWGGTPGKFFWEYGCGLRLQTLTLFQTKISNFISRYHFAGQTSQVRIHFHTCFLIIHIRLFKIAIRFQIVRQK